MRIPEAYVTGSRHERPVYLVIGEERRRIPDWYGIDVLGEEDKDNFTWGCCHAGCEATAYSIVREIYGRAFTDDLKCSDLAKYLARLDRSRGFRLTMTELWRIIGVGGG